MRLISTARSERVACSHCDRQRALRTDARCDLAESVEAAQARKTWVVLQEDGLHIARPHGLVYVVQRLFFAVENRVHGRYVVGREALILTLCLKLTQQMIGADLVAAAGVGVCKQRFDKRRSRRNFEPALEGADRVVPVA